jgi:preprotein translocase subunit Sec61beta
MEDMRSAYAKEAKRRGDKKPFLNPTIILVACALMIGFVLLNW